MLNTLYKIGEQLLEGQGIWAQLTTEPKLSKNKKHWVCPILFDCVNKEINVLNAEMELFKAEKSSIKFRYVAPAIWGPRGKKCALTVEPQKFYMLDETLFGKEGDDSGSMVSAMEDFEPKLNQTPIYKALQVINEGLKENRDELDLKKIKEMLGLGGQDKIVLFYSMIRSKNINNGEPIKLVSLDGYEKFIIGKFGTPENGGPGLDYISGNLSKEVIEAKFAGRYNIHKIFQTTASNYASGFSDFKKNFQADPDTLVALDRASEYALDNLQTQIAGIPHIVIPSFLNKDLDDFSLDETELFLKKSSELLFQVNSLEDDIERDLPEINLFWINYLAFESDGNSFKVINHIKDVNSQYLQKLIETFSETGIRFRDCIGGKYTFNLQSVYYIIPVRDGKKSKVNPVLSLFKDILEQRIVYADHLFQHFIELILCYWYDRHRAFPNIGKKESFDFAVKDAVFKYSALIYALKQLNLIDMEKVDSTSILQEIHERYPNPEIEEFLRLKKCSRNQIALFCLGRAVNVVGYAQERKGHRSKPILNKINFNGMTFDEVINLSKALMEKGQQYQRVRTSKGNTFLVRKKIEEWLDLFVKYSDEENWQLGREDAVFHLLAGYVFRPQKTSDEEVSENINTNN